MLNNIIAWGDAHLSNNLPWAEVKFNNGATDRLVEQYWILEKIVREGEKDKALGIFTGDLFDGRLLDPPVLHAFAQLWSRFEESNLPWIFIAGNHDFDSKDRTVSLYHFLNEFGGGTRLQFISQPLNVFNNDYNVIISCVPYHYDQKTMLQDIADLAEKVKQETDYENKWRTILVFHGDVFKAKWEHREAKGGMKLSDIPHIGVYDYIIGGHVHVKQKIKLTGSRGRLKHAFYTGSLVQKNLSETNYEKGFYKINLKAHKKTLVSLMEDFTAFKIIKSDDDLQEALDLEKKHIIEIRISPDDMQDEIKTLQKKHKVIIRSSNTQSQIITNFEEKRKVSSWEAMFEKEIKNQRLLKKHKEIMGEIK